MTDFGSLVQGRTTKPTLKCKKSKPVAKENWVVANDTHDAIIPLSHFKAVERLRELETRISQHRKLFIRFREWSGAENAAVKGRDR